MKLTYFCTSISVLNCILEKIPQQDKITIKIYGVPTPESRSNEVYSNPLCDDEIFSSL